MNTQMSTRGQERLFYQWATENNHSLFTLKDWSGAGFSRRQLEDRTKRGLVFCVFYKVYALSGAKRDPDFWIHAGCLKAGPVAAAYAGTSAAIWGLQQHGDRFHIASTRRLDPVDDHTFHRVALDRSEIQSVRGVPTTSVPRTLIDACGLTNPIYGARLVDRALIRKLTTLDELEAKVDAESRQGFAGLQTMRALLEKRDHRFEAASSMREVELLEFLKKYGFPDPQVNPFIDTGGSFPWRPDIYWPEADLVLERDVYFNHGDEDAHDRDRMKDLQMKVAGILVIRITDEMMKNPEKLARDLWKIFRERVETKRMRAGLGN